MMLRARTETGALALDPSLGTVAGLTFDWEGRRLEPLHRAPWLDEPAVQADADLLPVERRLQGDFFCAPFGMSDLTDAPAHGWTANSAWTGAETAGGVAAGLDRAVMGARVSKRLTLAADAPVLYQEHWIEGGAGGLTVAHHPMLRLAGGGRLCTSRKRLALTPEDPLEPSALLAYPAETTDLTAFPARDRDAPSMPDRVRAGLPGSTRGPSGPEVLGSRPRPTALDLTRLPLGSDHEDFVTLVEGDGPLGWTAVLRDAEDDVVLFLKDPAVLPVTMLWFSNGGRDYAPWNGRHRGVLGVEDGIAAGAAGHAAATGDNALARRGVRTALTLGPTHRIAHAIVALPRDGWETVASVAVEGATLVLVAGDGRVRRLPFAAGFFGAGTPWPRAR